MPIQYVRNEYARPYAGAEADIGRKRRQAEILRAEANQKIAPVGQMVSGRFVQKQTPQYLADLLRSFNVGYADQQTRNAIEDLRGRQTSDRSQLANILRGTEPPIDALRSAATQGNVLAEDALIQAKLNEFTSPDKTPTKVREYQFAVQNGFEGTYADFLQLDNAAIQRYKYWDQLPPDEQGKFMDVQRAGQKMDLGGEVYYRPPGGGRGEVYEKSIPPQEDPGFRGQQKYQEAVGSGQGKRDIELKTGFVKNESRYRNLRRKWNNAQTAINEAKDMVGFWTTGVGGEIADLAPWNVQRRDFVKVLDTIRAQLGFRELTQMRMDSPTGGALGQVSELENRLLQATTANIEQFQSPAQMRKHLRQIDRDLKQLINDTNIEYKQTYAEMMGVDPRTIKEKSTDRKYGTIEREPAKVDDLLKQYGYGNE